ncbi:hypothetical protein [Leeia aquatica]|uniref:Uncharacterized protein n=1 Tax=Leeia aquatica TaxID=2725557 RepID=A0A847S8T6_9NEIS|nr:hypothetical protein [Leeia aquatica]NLR74016.1 hypothetical protein [Leeia aquatica]
MRLNLGWVAGLLVMTCAAGEVESLPPVFEGKWAVTVADCKQPNNVLTLQRHSLQMGNGRAEMQSLTMLSPVQYRVRMKLSGGGRVREEMQTLFLSHDGKSLLWISNVDKPHDSEWFALVRCQ